MISDFFFFFFLLAHCDINSNKPTQNWGLSLKLFWVFAVTSSMSSYVNDFHLKAVVSSGCWDDCVFCSAEMQVAVTDNCLEIFHDDINMGLLLNHLLVFMFLQLLPLADSKHHPEGWKGELSVLVDPCSTWKIQGLQCFHDDEVEMLPLWNFIQEVRIFTYITFNCTWYRNVFYFVRGIALVGKLWLYLFNA